MTTIDDSWRRTVGEALAEAIIHPQGFNPRWVAWLRTLEPDADLPPSEVFSSWILLRRLDYQKSGGICDLFGRPKDDAAFTAFVEGVR